MYIHTYTKIPICLPEMVIVVFICVYVVQKRKREIIHYISIYVADCFFDNENLMRLNYTRQ